MLRAILAGGARPAHVAVARGARAAVERGEGGGHDGAAGWSGSVDIITAESSFISHVARIPRSSDR